MKAHDIPFGILERRDPAHVFSDFHLRQDDHATRLLHLLARCVDGEDRDVVHERLTWIFTPHQSPIDAGLSFGPGLNEVIIHFPGIRDFPTQGLLVEFLGAFHIVCWNLEMNDAVWHRCQQDIKPCQPTAA